MDFIQAEINGIVQGFNAAPYLFIGSGFSRRYLGLEDWEGLLRKFCGRLKKYEYYRSDSDGDFPKIASAIAHDFNDMIWGSDHKPIIKFVEQNKDQFKVRNSAIKIAIANYIKKIGISKVKKEYENEIEVFRKINIEGIITTNWDTLLEDIFPDFKRVIGQDELIHSNPFGIGEIFKIHGCCSSPESLILTDEDYQGFNSKNAYLAAKLVTYFVENPVIFIGYSLSDPNVTEILTSIVKCLGEEHFDKLSSQFIFIQRAKGNEEVTKSIKLIGAAQIPITIIKLKDYSKIYKPLVEIKRRLPVRLLRYFKEQLYEFIHTNDPNGKIAVVDIEASSNVEDIEFAIGVGIHQQLARKGYDRIHVGNLIHDILFDTEKFDAKQLIETCIPNIQGNVPIFKYFSELEDGFDYRNLKKSAKKAYTKQDPISFSSETYRRQFEKHWKDKDIAELYKLKDYDKSIRLLACHYFSEEELEPLGDYLRSIYPHYFENGEPLIEQNTFFRKIVCLYDLLKYNTER